MPPPKPDPKRLLLLPLAVGGLARVWYALSHWGQWLPPYDRGEGYYEGALNFLSMHLLASDLPARGASALRGPLFPGFIILIEALFDPWPGRVRLAQALLGTGMIGAAWGLGATLVSPWAGLLAATLVALDPLQIDAVAALDLNIFYAACVLGLAAVLVRWAREPAPRWTAALAVSLGASFLCRTSHYLLPALLAAAAPLWWGPRDALRRIGLLAGLMVLVLTPYTVRNALHMRRFVPLDTGAGSYRLYAAAIGEEACCDEGQLQGYRAIAARAAGFSPFERPMQEVEPLVIKEAFKRIKEDPKPFVANFKRTMADFWRPYRWLLLLGLFAFWGRRRDKGLQAFWLLIVSFVGYHIMVTSPWHAFVARPLAQVAAACGAAALLAAAAKPLRLKSPFFLKGDPAETGGLALAGVMAASYAAVVFVCGAEFALKGAEPDYERALKLMNLSVTSTNGRYGLAERGQLYVYMDRPAEARRDLLAAKARGYVFPYQIPTEEQAGAPASRRPRGARGSARGGVVIDLDPRVELVTIASLLSQPGVETGGPPAAREYAAAVRRHFASWSEHEAVRRLADWRKRGVRVDGILEYVLHASEPPELEVGVEPWAGAVAGLPSLAERKRLLAELREFARLSGFSAFLAEQSRIRDSLVESARAEAARGASPDELRRYLGADFGDFRVHLAPLVPPSLGLQQAMRVEPDFTELVRFPGPRGGFSLDTFGMSLGHELTHRLTGEWSSRAGRELESTPAPAGCGDRSGNAWSCLDEFVVRAVEERVLRRRAGGSGELRTTGFAYQPALLSALERYEAERSRYPTLGEFYPRIVEAVRAYKPRETARPSSGIDPNAGPNPGQGPDPRLSGPAR